jgi:hypothetical protein
VARLLRPGGIFLVLFSNRMFPEKAVKVWRESSDRERVLLVQDFFAAAPEFGPSRCFGSQGQPRPKGDRYSALGIPSDPVCTSVPVHSSQALRDGIVDDR